MIARLASAFVAERGREAVYDAEHFFDGYKADRDYALSTLRAARQAGARTLVLCDTNGGTMTDELVRIVADVRTSLEADPDAPDGHLGHPHPQRRGARGRQLDGRGGRPASATSRRRSTATASAAATRTWSASWPTSRSRPPHVARPGRRRRPRGPDRALALASPRSPTSPRTTTSRTSGARRSRTRAASTARRSPRSSAATSTSTRRRSATSAGWSSRSSAAGRTPRSGPSSSAIELEGVVDPRESVDAHQAARVRGARVRGRRGERSSCSSGATRPTTRAPFRIVDYTCLVEQRDGRELLAEATVKVEVDGEVLHTAADGNGPVNALDAALRKALGAFYPGSTTSTSSTTRCASSTAGRRRPPGRGSSSTRPTARGPGRRWAATRTSSRPRRPALADSLEYAIWKSGAELRRRDERHFTTGSTADGAPNPPTATRRGDRHARR